MVGGIGGYNEESSLHSSFGDWMRAPPGCGGVQIGVLMMDESKVSRRRYSAFATPHFAPPSII